jgi:hypothetical protein
LYGLKWQQAKQAPFGHESPDFRALKSLDFQGPPLPMALVMDLPPSKGEGAVQNGNFSLSSLVEEK